MSIQRLNHEKMTRVHDTLVKDSLLVVIFPFKFTDFKYDQLGLSYFERYCDVLVLDISMITAPKLAKGVSVKRCKKNEVVTVSSLFSFIRHVYELRRRSTKINIAMLTAIRGSSPSEVICNLIIVGLLKRKCVVFDLYNPGVPNLDPGDVARSKEFGHDSGLLAKFLRLAKNATTLLEARKALTAVFLGRLKRFLPSATTHRLVAGEDSLKVAEQEKRAKDKIKLVFGHCDNYSNNLLAELKPPVFDSFPQKMAVFLDGAGPMFGSDFLHSGRKGSLTSDKWYPLVTRFIDQVEDQTGVQIVIAGHYKTTHPEIAPCFGNRPVYYGKTRDLVWNSEFVITRASSSFSYAVMSKKPIIFIYSNQQKNDFQLMRDTCVYSAMLGAEPVNIDDPPIHIDHLLKIDEERYLNFKKICLTSTNSKRPNVQIILEDIMNISTGSDFARTSPD